MTNFQKYSGSGDAEHPSYSLGTFNKFVFPFIEHLFSKEKRVLDVGCGNGRHSKLFSPLVNSVVAIDGFMNADFSDFSNIEFKRLELLEEDGSYDLIFCHGVFYHMFGMHGSKAFSKLLSLLNPGGRLVILEGDWLRENKGYSMDDLVNSHICSYDSSEYIPEWGSFGGRLTVILK